MTLPKAPRTWALPGGRPAIVLGRSQHLLPVSSPLPIRRRASGGGAVLAGPWLLRAAVRLPRGHALVQHGPAALARWLGSVHLQWLHAHGIRDARIAESSGRSHWACFAGLGVGELSIGGRKLTGIAQAWRRSGVLAAAGTLLHPAPWPLLCEALERPLSDAVELAANTVSLSECAGRQIAAPVWARSLQASLESALRLVAASPSEVHQQWLGVAPDQRDPERSD